jgi:hypothetical protein
MEWKASLQSLSSIIGSSRQLSPSLPLFLYVYPYKSYSPNVHIMLKDTCFTWFVAKFE